ncbi:YchJ family protein [Marmoricola endophyticus]|nr:YchJ family metal-binding protein [Marmoricola endophyticus]
MSGLCPCGTGAAYHDCCEPILDGHPAPTAERLMRSRYTAFVRHDADHLFRSWHPRTRPDEVTAAGVEWTGLEVLRTEDGGEGDEHGTVEFIARYDGGEVWETSRFVHHAGRWVYVGPE